jgi:hypothetical protein
MVIFPRMPTNADIHVRNVVAQHTPRSFNIQAKIDELKPHILAWSNGYSYQLKQAGSIAKGTAIIGTSDIDFFISLDPSVKTHNTLENVYTTLRNRFKGAGYEVREQNVSIGIDHTGLKIDLVAGVRQNVFGQDHSIWKRKAQTWTKTNIDEHIRVISKSGRTADIKAIKIWRKLQGLDFPSFYLELSVIEALKGKPILGGSPSRNFIDVMNYLNSDFLNKVIKDPANQDNEVSDELTGAEKNAIKNAASKTLSGQWNQALW